MKFNVSPSGWIFAKAAYSNIKYAIYLIIAHSRLLTTIYFALTPYYRREQRGVACGILKHLKDVRGRGASFFLLRRNIHRIEKGLVMPKRRPLFAVNYIAETVEYYSQCLKDDSSPAKHGELLWATDILHQYFSTVESHPFVKSARSKFLEIASDPKRRAIPYQRGTKQPDISFDDLLALARRRKSVRTFVQKPVPRNLVDSALTIATHAPSSCNRQPIQYHIYDDGPILSEMRRLPLGAAGFAENIPMICALTGDHSAYLYERDRHSIYIDGSLSAMLFMLALETVGLASCPLMWTEINSLDRRFEKMTGLPPHQRVIMFLAIGFPDPEGNVAYSERKTLESLRVYNHFQLSQSPTKRVSSEAAPQNSNPTLEQVI